ncbi:hypothetical protein AY599_12425 [Leptolyngbya valderiana BDU 20041]|nr:hypothetical protein AY599_12425 [Leptolyngbya valderiana BDU 20041]
MGSATAILQLTQAKGLGPVTLDRLLQRTIELGFSVEDVVAASISELTETFGLRQPVAEAVKTSRDEACRLSDELAAKDVRVLVRNRDGYPTKLSKTLGDRAPLVLFARGNLALLEQPAVGFCGSRKTSERGLEVARDCAAMLAERQIDVVSGYANGTDLAAHRGALAAGGTTTLVMAEGILNFRKKRELAEIWDRDRLLVLSEFSPKARWVARNAMTRNWTIAGLSGAMVLVESGMTGGTFAAGETTLELNLPLFVVEYADPPVSAEANRWFLDRGAIALRRRPSDLKPNLDRLFEMLKPQPDSKPQSNAASSTETAAQLQLNL